jgi:hypothetical protein
MRLSPFIQTLQGLARLGLQLRSNGYLCGFLVQSWDRSKEGTLKHVLPLDYSSHRKRDR